MRADFAAIYDDHIWDVYGFIGYRVPRRDLAEDLTQQTFERALRSWNSFDPARASAKTWLLTIARNLVIDHYRAARQDLPLEELGGAEPVTEDAPDLGLEPELARALSDLGERDREVVALCRCGKSRLRPFCDGSHKLVRFRAPSGVERGREE